ncbi:hypothetical protein AVEN_42003-1, partial [Araneus ventricosus]
NPNYEDDKLSSNAKRSKNSLRLGRPHDSLGFKSDNVGFTLCTTTYAVLVNLSRPYVPQLV